MTRALSLLLVAPGSQLAAQSARAPARSAPAQSPAAARVAHAVDARALQAHLEFLAADALEGRGMGTRGATIAVRYIAAQFARLGLEPAGDSGTWYQRIPLTGRIYTTSLVLGDSAPAATHSSDSSRAGSDPPFRPGDDYVAYVTTGDSAALAAQPVFVGYGITASEEQWDDYAGADVRGKLVIALAGIPAERGSPRFVHPRRDDYGARKYKVEEAVRHGAAGGLVVFRPGGAGPNWFEIAGALTGEQLHLNVPDTASAAGPVFGGWLNQPAAARIAAAAGLSLDSLAAAADRPGFRAVPLPVTLTLSVRARSRAVPGVNVAARLPGRGALADQAVVIGAHYDHLGIGRPVNGDSIYDGAEDNASGVAGMLAIAQAFVHAGARPGRSVYFAAFGAEEEGLLGSEAFALRPPIPLDSIAAMFCMDVLNLQARTRDLASLGGSYSSLGALFRSASAAEGYRPTPPDSPIMRLAVAQNFFNRSDQASFARAGVPAIYLYFGDVGPDGSRDWGLRQLVAYLSTRYHRPNDDLSQRFDYSAAVYPLRVFARTLLAAADEPTPARWNADAPYHRH
ncbi:MAG TPA: M28 family peptidase [Gemmatimonadales bacterium]|nr:M28 family peptidase [Gemmatimonadales bacterium]